MREALKPVLSLWIDTAIKAVLDLEPIHRERLWFCIDELPTLQKLDILKLALTNTRKYGLCMVLGVQVLEMGVFAGILTGALSGYLYNKYSGVQFNGAMAIYSGHCFVAIVMLPVSMLLGVVMSELWPYAQHGISALALAIKGSGPLGVAIYGFLERILVPTGLHHLVYTPFLYTELGGTQEVCGATYQGARNIYFAEMACPDVKQLSSTVVWDARGISKMFGLPAAALAMYMTAKPERKAIAKAILIPAALTSLLVGVTEPIEFSFLFVAPLLFVVHAVLTGIGMMLFSLLGVHAIGANGIIDFILYNLPLGTTTCRVTALVVTPIFGLHLERAGMRTTLVPQWHYVIWACVIVFFWQLVRPAMRGVTRTWSLPALPSVPESALIDSGRASICGGRA